VTLGGCEKLGDQMVPSLAEQVAVGLTVQKVDWNTTSVDVGQVAAVTEVDDMTVIYSDKGALVFSGGALAQVDGSITSWVAAATVAAADGDGQWAMGLSKGGQLYRIRDESTLEDVSDRYGLANTRVRGIAPMGGARVAFVLDGAVVVADGSLVTTYDLSLASWSAGGTMLAGVRPDGSAVRFDTEHATIVTYQMMGPVASVFDASNGLLVASAHALARDFGNGTLIPIYRTTGTMSQLVAGGSRVWIALGSELGAVDGDTVAVSTGAGVPAGATLIASPTGDVWALAGGVLTRYGVKESGDEGLWRQSAQPVYAHVCSMCHGPSGNSGIDLSTYSSWLSRRSLIDMRVLVKMDMPPSGTPISDADKQAVAVWTRAMSQPPLAQ
jgi:hypothetical protein